MLARVLSLAIALSLEWLLLSGHFTPLILGLGAASVVLVTALATRMGLVDSEGQPLELLPGVLLYWPYLVGEIVKANLDVMRRIVAPERPISPTLVEAPAEQQTVVGRVVYANSITLTPGTVSIDVASGRVLVHALAEPMATQLIGGEMGRRVRQAEGLGR